MLKRCTLTTHTQHLQGCLTFWNFCNPCSEPEDFHPLPLNWYSLCLSKNSRVCGTVLHVFRINSLWRKDGSSHLANCRSYCRNTIQCRSWRNRVRDSWRYSCGHCWIFCGQLAFWTAGTRLTVLWTCWNHLYCLYRCRCTVVRFASHSTRTGLM